MIKKILSKNRWGLAVNRLIFFLCLLSIISIQELCAQKQSVRYTDEEGNVYTSEFELIKYVMGPNNRPKTGSNASFEEDKGVQLRLVKASDWKPSQPNPLPIIKKAWIRHPSFLTLGTTIRGKGQEMKTAIFKFPKNENADFSNLHEFKIIIGYGHQGNNEDQGSLAALFVHNPKPKTETQSNTQTPIASKKNPNPPSQSKKSPQNNITSSKPPKTTPKDKDKPQTIAKTETDTDKETDEAINEPDSEELDSSRNIASQDSSLGGFYRRIIRRCDFFLHRPKCLT